MVQMLLARTLGGLFSGILCSGVMSLTGPCPPSSSCEWCDDTLPGRRRNYAEISSGGGNGNGKGEEDRLDTAGVGGAVGNVASAFQRADAWWHAGLTLGPLIGGLSYGATLLGARRPALVACVAACLSVAIFAAWSSPGVREAILRGIRRRDSYRNNSSSSGGGGGNASDWGRGGFLGRRKAGFGDRADEEDGGAGAPLLGDVSVHDPGVATTSHQLPVSSGVSDLEAGGSGGPSADGPVSER